MSSCSGSCSGCNVEGCGARAEDAPTYMDTNSKSNVRYVIGVVSGKGGVGKSLVTSLLASEMQKKGYKVAILDADVTGPSIPKTFGVESKIAADMYGVIPCKTESGIKIISTNLMLPEDDQFVAWRGPVVAGVIQQFWNETSWGDIDVLFVDMPPGTSDVFLTVFQQLPVDGIITVSAPQELVGMIVGKAVNLAHNMDVNVLGLVENMSYFVCDQCGKKHYIYGKPQAEAIAKKYDIPAYANLPIDPVFAELCDEGKIEQYDVKGALDPIIAKIDEVMQGESKAEKDKREYAERQAARAAEAAAEGVVTA